MIKKIIFVILFSLTDSFSLSAVAGFEEKYQVVSLQMDEILAEKRASPSTDEELEKFAGEIRALPDLVQSPNWKSQRSLKLKLMMQVLLVSEKLEVPNFDFSKKPTMNVMPPKASGLPSGADSPAIRDPVLRAEYEASIAANRALVETYVLQYSLIRFKKNWISYIVSYCSHYFSTSEVEQLQNEFRILETADAQSILQQVQTRMVK